MIFTLTVIKGKAGKSSVLRFGGVPPEKQIKDDLANRVNIRSPAYLGGRVGVELFGRCPVPCIGKKCTAVIIHVSDAVKVDKLHKLCYCIIRGILQDKYVFGLQVKAEKT